MLREWSPDSAKGVNRMVRHKGGGIPAADCKTASAFSNADASEDISQTHHNFNGQKDSSTV